MANSAHVLQACELNTFAFEKLAYGFWRVNTNLVNKTFSEILTWEEQVAIFFYCVGKYHENVKRQSFCSSKCSP